VCLAGCAGYCRAYLAAQAKEGQGEESEQCKQDDPGSTRNQSMSWSVPYSAYGLPGASLFLARPGCIFCPNSEVSNFLA